MRKTSIIKNNKIKIVNDNRNKGNNRSSTKVKLKAKDIENYKKLAIIDDAISDEYIAINQTTKKIFNLNTDKPYCVILTEYKHIPTNTFIVTEDDYEVN